MPKTKGSPDPVSLHPGRELTKPPSLPSNFLYFGAGRYLGHFDVLIRQYGIRVQHTHSVVCPCVEVNTYGGTGEADPDCSSCYGRGTVFVEEDTEEHIAIVTGIGESENGIDRGSITVGEVQITVPSQVIFDVGDRVVFPDTVVPIKLIRKFSKKVGGFVLPFRVSFVDALVTKGPRSDDPLISLVLGKDYTLNTEKRIVYFPEGSRVTDGLAVSGTFIGTPDYIIDRAIHAARGRLDSLASNAKHIQFPRTYTAVRGDATMGYEQDEISHTGSVQYR